jgi:hypothetical protein
MQLDPKADAKAALQIHNGIFSSLILDESKCKVRSDCVRTLVLSLGVDAFDEATLGGISIALHQDAPQWLELPIPIARGVLVAYFAYH